MNLNLSGQSVDTVAFDYAVSLRLDSGVNIRIGTEFSLRTPSGRMVAIEPEQVGPGIEHIVSVLRETLADAVAQDSGTLTLDFENGARIEVPAHRDYEAWTFAGPNSWLVVALPGGALGIWGPNG